MKSLFILISIAFTHQLVSATPLPEFYQDADVLKKILSSPKVAAIYGSENQIKSITKNKDGYSIHSGQCSMKIYVEYQRKGQNTEIKTYPQKPVCLEEEKPELSKKEIKQKICRVAMEEYSGDVSFNECMDNELRSQNGAYQLKLLICGDAGVLVTFKYGSKGEISYGDSGAGEMCED